MRDDRSEAHGIAGRDVQHAEREELLLASRGASGYMVSLANLEPAICNTMLAHPSGEIQTTIRALCQRYGLFMEDWYVWIKRELARRGIITSSTTVVGMST